jgi:hypothetical protein
MNANKYKAGIGGSLFFGLNIYQFNLGLEGGFVPRVFYDAWTYTITNPTVEYVGVSYMEVPAFLHLGYSFQIGSLTLQPGIKAGAYFDFMPEVATRNLPSGATSTSTPYGGRKQRTDISLAGGPELTAMWTFPGDRLSFFLRGGYNVIYPVVHSTDTWGGNVGNLLYLYPSLGAGLVIYPAGGGTGLASLEAHKGERFVEALPVKLPEMEALFDGHDFNAEYANGKTMHDLLETMRAGFAPEQALSKDKASAAAKQSVQKPAAKTDTTSKTTAQTLPDLAASQDALNDVKQDINSLKELLSDIPSVPTGTAGTSSVSTNDTTKKDVR